MYKKICLAILGLCALTVPAKAQIYDVYSNMYPTEYEILIKEVEIRDTIRDTVYIHISTLEDILKEFGMTFEEYVQQFMRFKNEMDSAGVISSDRIYMNYFFPLLDSNNSFLNQRVVTREYRFRKDGQQVEMKRIDHADIDSLEKGGYQTDCMLVCSGITQTKQFITSPAQIKSCLSELFSDIYRANGKINGLNIYFPDYDFREKKAMAQFVKSVSLVIDSMKMPEIHDLRFYVSFDEEKGRENYNYLCGLTQMADSVFLFEPAAEGGVIPRTSVIDHQDAEAQGMLPKLRNQLHMAKFHIKPFPEIDTEEFRVEDIYNLIDADYPYNHWEMYLFILIAIGVVMLAAIVLYKMIPEISFYINKNLDYTYSLIVMLFLEILLLTATMFETMSLENVFTLGNDNRAVVLLLPLLFVFIVPMMKAVAKRRQLP